MFTYLPTERLSESVEYLTIPILLEQIEDIISILDILHEVDEDVTKRDLPIVKMWRGHEPHLAELGLLSLEYRTRIIKGAPKGQITKALDQLENMNWHLNNATAGDYSLSLPKWVGNRMLHWSHQAALLRKDPEHYGDIFAGVPSTLPVYWPSNG